MKQWQVASGQWAVRSFFRLLREALREIFDEAAYARFLARQGISSSRAAYGAFLCESAASRERRPRCC
jgi:hypothetical protein